MAKLSVYNTIDRSQLGGKFVPLIQSGVNNYKILASDLGKEYSPGDAIEITDTGVINVNYDPETLRLSGSGLGVKTDAARGVFGGSNGIYIASADSSIGISNAGIYIQVADHSIGVGSHGIYLKTADNSISVHTNGIKVDPSALVGKGLSGDGGTLYVVSANDSILVSSHGIKVNPWDGLSADSHGLYVEVADTTISVNSDGVKVRTGYGLIASDYGLSVRPADDSIDTSYAGIKVNPSAITGTGLVTTNGAIGVNVNTATGIIVKDNKLYLNSGDGLQTSNNAVSVKAADKSINVLSSGIKVNTGYGLSATADGLYVQPSDSSIYVSSGGVRVRVREGGGILSGDDGLYFDSGAIELPSAGSLSGAGLGHTYSNLYVMSADNSIGVSNDGIKVNTYALAGYGLSAASDGLSVHLYGNTNIKISDDGGYLYAAADFMAGEGLKAMHGTALGVNYGSGLGIDNNGLLAVKLGDRLGFDPYGYVYAASSYTVGPGLTHSSGALEVRPANDSIVVSNDGVKVNPSFIAGYGLTSNASGKLEIYCGSGLNFDAKGMLFNALYAGSGIKLENNYISVHVGSGLTIDGGGSLSVKPSHTINVSPDGVGVSVQSGGGILTGEQGLYLDSHSLPSANSLAGPGLGHRDGMLFNALYAGSGIKLENNCISVHVGSGLTIDGGGSLSVKPDNTTLKLRDTGLYVDTYYVSGAIAGEGLVTGADGKLNVKTHGSSIGVSSHGIKVNPSALAGHGLSAISDRLYIQSANRSIEAYADGIRVNTGYGLSTTSDGLYVKSADNSIDVSSNGIKVDTLNLAGSGLGGAGGLYVMSADKSIGVSSNGIKVNVQSGGGILSGEQGLYLDYHSSSLPSASSLAGDGLGHRDGKLFNALYAGSGIEIRGNAINVYAGSGLKIDDAGILVSALYAGSGAKLENNYISVHVGSGLTIDGGGSLSVKPSHTINVSPDGVGVSVQSGGGILTGVGGVYIDSAQLAGKGLSANISANNVKLNVDSSALAGAGLEAHSNGTLYVRSADNFIDSYSSGVGLNVFNLYAHVEANSSNIERSNTSLNAIVAKSDNGVKLTALYSGSGISIHNTGSIDVDTDNSTIKIGSNGLYADPSALAGASLYVDSANKTLNVEYGDGLTTGAGELKVKAADTTISVGSGGISVNTVDLSHALAGNGLTASNAGLYVKSADNSLVVGINGLYIDPGDGLSKDVSGLLCIKSKDGSIVPTWEGLAVDIRNAAYIGAGLTTAGDLKVKAADNSISVSSDGIKVAEGFGLPDYSSGITVNQNTEYTADTNCWLYMWLHCGGQSSNDIIIKSIYIDGIEVLTLGSYVFNRIPVMIPCKKGSKYEFRNVLTGTGNYKLIVYKCLV